MDTLNSQIFLDDKLILPQSKADNIIYSDTTLKNAFDNYNPITMSNFGKNICKCSSLADVCRLFHLNYFFAKDIADNVVWNIAGNPTVDNQKLHSSNANYIYRTLALGSYDLSCEFDLASSDLGNKIVFQFFDGFSPSHGSTYYRIQLRLNADGELTLYAFSNSYTYGAWNSDYKYFANNIVLGKFSSAHVKFSYTKSSNSWSVYLNNSLKSSFTLNMPARNWGVYLGLTADCYIDNFSLSYNSNIISELDFD